jgi:esterase
VNEANLPSLAERVVALHFREYGSGPPLIILHGLFGSLDNWESMSRRFAANFHVFAIDQRNHGLSPHTAEMNYPLMAADLFRFVGDHQLPSAHVLGHSMGGKTAMQFALCYPDAVEKLIIADIAPRAYPPYHTEILAAMRSLDLAALRTRKQAEDALTPMIRSLALRRFLLKNLRVDGGGALHWKLGLEEIEQNYHALGEAVAGQKPFTKPALFLRGENSDYIQDEDIQTINELFPNAEVRTVPGAGHWMHVEEPEGFFRIVHDFLYSKNASRGI